MGISRSRADAWVALAAPLLLACGSNCPGFCPPHDVTVTATGEVGMVSLLVGDSACSGAAVSCTAPGDAGACFAFAISLPRDGNCHIEVELAEGAHASSDVSIDRQTGCCPGFFANPLSAGDIEVP